MERLHVWLLVLSGVLWLRAPADCEAYRWSDDQGTTHMTDQVAPGRAVAPPSIVHEDGLEIGRPSNTGETSSPSTPAQPEGDPLRAELSRRQSRLSALQAHAQLLQASGTSRTPDQLRMENQLDGEIRTETDAIAELQRRSAAAAAP